MSHGWDGKPMGVGYLLSYSLFFCCLIFLRGVFFFFLISRSLVNF